MPQTREITAAHIAAPALYAATRRQRRADMIARKKSRRVAVGPNATMHFENFATMLYQVQEMLHTEKGGAEQLADELAAYNPLIPQGNELVGTLMLEFEDPATRPDILRGLTGIEETIVLDVGGEQIRADWEQDVDRTAEDGKTSSIHFIRFSLSPAQVDKFRDVRVPVTLAVTHDNYAYATPIAGATRQDLIGDL
jgi:hypothetical protein